MLPCGFVIIKLSGKQIERLQNRPLFAPDGSACYELSYCYRKAGKVKVGEILYNGGRISPTDTKRIIQIN